MLDENILQEIKKACSMVFDCDIESIHVNTKKDDIDEWDSMHHLMLMAELEEVFSIRFTTKEISSLDSVDRLLTAIVDKVGVE